MCSTFGINFSTIGLRLLRTRSKTWRRFENEEQEKEQEEEPLDSAGLEELSRAYIGSNLPVGFGAKEDLVHSKCIHSVG